MLSKKNAKEAQAQYDRMILLYLHIKQLKNGIIFAPTDFSHPQEINRELALSFFIRAHHMIDWVNSTGSRDLKKKLHRVIDESTALKICSDLCNKEKHCSLSKFRFKTGCQPLFKIESDGVEHVDDDLLHLSKYRATYQIEVESDIYDAIFVAESCLFIWSDILEANINNNLHSMMHLSHY